MASEKNHRPQFSLAALLGAVVICGVAFGLVVNMETTYRLTLRCQTLPASDEALAKWIRRQGGVIHVATVREGNTVVVTVKKRFGSFELPRLPLAELGYTVHGMESTASLPSTFGAARTWIGKVPPWLWLAIAASGAAILAVQVLHARKAACDKET
jgi:hypothetical protein